MQVDFIYDFGSPTAYLACYRLRSICAERNAKLNYQPVLLGGVFKATNNTSPALLAAKGKWLFDDIARHAKRDNIAFKMNPHFILNTLCAMRGAMWALNNNVIERYTEAMFHAAWADGLDISNPAQMHQVVTKAGLDANAMAEAVQRPEVKKQLISATEQAVSRGVFGAPTMFVGGDMHFGQDRVDWVAEALGS